MQDLIDLKKSLMDSAHHHPYAMLGVLLLIMITTGRLWGEQLLRGRWR